MIWQDDVYLAVDPTLVAQNDGTTMVRQEAGRHAGRPTIPLTSRALNPSGRADQLQVKLVLNHAGRYRMWYRMWSKADSRRGTTGKTAPIYYAESNDGIDFKPVRITRRKGVASNQLIDGLEDSNSGQRTSGFFFDPLDPDWPFKCVVYRPGRVEDFDPGVLARYPHYRGREWQFIWGIGRSTDGLVWQLPNHDHDMIHAMPEAARLHRAADGGLVIADQMMSGMADWAYRNVKGWITYDHRTAHRIPDYVYSLPQHMVRCQEEYTGPCSVGRPWIQPHVGLVVARKGPTFVAMSGYLYGANAYETFAQTAEIGLAFSNSGIRFQDVWPFMPFIRRGLPGQWDAGMVRQDAIVDDGDQTRFYYTGNEIGNLGGHYQSSFAVIERDRYGYRLIQGGRDIAVHSKVASFTLKPCTLSSRSNLAINVSHVGSGRDVRLELQDGDGTVVPGYEVDQCMPVTRAGVRRTIHWRHGKALRELAGQTVRVRVELRSRRCGMVGVDSPRVYAIYTA